MKSGYVSFLICQHPNVVNVFINGLPVGVIRQGKFEPHQFTNPDGTKRTIQLANLTPPFPFASLEEFKAAMIAAINQIAI